MCASTAACSRSRSRISVATALVFGLVSALTVRAESASGALVAPGRVTMSRARAPRRVRARRRRGRARHRAADRRRPDSAQLRAAARRRSGLPDRPRDDAGDDGPRRSLQGCSGARAFLRSRVREPAGATQRQRGRCRSRDAADRQQLDGAVRACRSAGRGGERPPEVGWQVGIRRLFQGAADSAPRRAAVRRHATRRRGKPVVIVSEALQRRFFPNESAVGRLFKTGRSARWRSSASSATSGAPTCATSRAPTSTSRSSSDPATQITLFVRTVVRSGRCARRRCRRRCGDRAEHAIFANAHAGGGRRSDSMQVTQLALWLLGIFAAIGARARRGRHLRRDVVRRPSAHARDRHACRARRHAVRHRLAGHAPGRRHRGDRHGDWAWRRPGRRPLAVGDPVRRLAWRSRHRRDRRDGAGRDDDRQRAMCRRAAPPASIRRGRSQNHERFVHGVAAATRLVRLPASGFASPAGNSRQPGSDRTASWIAWYRDLGVSLVLRLSTRG